MAEGALYGTSFTLARADRAVSEAVIRPNLSGRTALDGQQALTGRRRGLRALLPFVGPAVVASIAYMDPGNFATNIQAGARYGYMLLWVVLLANVIAMLFQALSARLGIVTGHSLAALCRLHFPRPLVIAMWLASEVAAMATDLAESIGAAIGISVLFHLPLLAGLLITFAITWGLLTFQSRGFRPIELIITGFVGIISLAYLDRAVHRAARLGSGVLPQRGAATLRAGQRDAGGRHRRRHGDAARDLSALGHDDEPGARPSPTEQRRRLIGYSNLEVLIALSLAGLVNMAMVAMAATVFHQGHSDVGEIETAYHTLLPLMGVVAAGAFMTSLLASGLSSSVVGTMAGQVIMQDFVGFRIPMWVRRAVTMVPAVVVVAMGVNATNALVLSQVVLSLVLPVPMIALLVLIRRPGRDGRVRHRARYAGRWPWPRPVVVLVLNAILLLQSFGN